MFVLNLIVKLILFMQSCSMFMFLFVFFTSQILITKMQSKLNLVNWSFLYAFCVQIDEMNWWKSANEINTLL